MQFDLTTFKDEPGKNDMQELAKLAEEMLSLQAQVDDAKAALKEKEERLRMISEELIPAHMDRVGWWNMNAVKGKAECKLMVNGQTWKLAVAHDLRASIPTDPKARQTTFTYLRQNGAGSLIKRKVTVGYGRDEGAAADALVSILRERGDNFEDREDVHPGTLKSWVKEKMESGEDIAFEIIGVHPFAKTTIKL